MKVVACLQCSKEFKTYPCWVKRNGGKFCSYRCMGDSRIGKATYVRTDEHKLKMSKSHKALDQTRNRDRLIRINAAKKGKTIDELYPEKADELRLLRSQQTGDKNPNWKGGKHRNKYPWVFFKVRPEIIGRDGNKCMNCGMTGEEHKSRYTGRGLTVHHVDYDKENNALSNLITLCIWCNCKANGKREQWQSHYAALLGR